LKAGDSDIEVRDYLVTRYGDFVLLKPPFRASTLVLWLAPVLMLLLAAVMISRHLRGPRPVGHAAPDAPLSAEEERRLAEILKSAPDEQPSQRS
jgi:cytochrome c-type biogenesis protein CcmH